MLPRRFNTLGTCLDTELRAFFVFVVAKALNHPPHTLPRMTDVQLWQSFKVAASIANPYADIPSPITDPLNSGDIFAIETGLMRATTEFPTGDDPEEIYENAKSLEQEPKTDSSWDDYHYLIMRALFFGRVPSILNAMQHPKAKQFNDFLRDGYGYVEHPQTEAELLAFFDNLEAPPEPQAAHHALPAEKLH